MPLIALRKSTNERIDITKLEDPRMELRADDLVCPICDSRMTLVSAVRDATKGIVRIAHFRHLSMRDCIYTAYQTGESEEHRSAKVWLREQLLQESGFQVPVELEYHIPEVRRIADVAQIFPTGWIVVHEIQLAAISISDLEARSRDYLAAGCDVIWYLGNKAKNDTNRRWAREFMGFECIIEFESDQDEHKRFVDENGVIHSQERPSNIASSQNNGLGSGVMHRGENS